MSTCMYVGRHTQTSMGRLNALSLPRLNQNVGESPSCLRNVTRPVPSAMCRSRAMYIHTWISQANTWACQMTPPTSYKSMLACMPLSLFWRREESKQAYGSAVPNLRSAGLAETRPGRGIFRVLMHVPFRCPSSSATHLHVGRSRLA